VWAAVVDVLGGERVAAVPVRTVDPLGTHASWMENFPWTRLGAVRAGTKPEIALPLPDDPAAVRAALGDGSYGGPYEHADAEMLRIWAVGVDETRSRIQSL
jgi:creatinine amidohydrolase